MTHESYPILITQRMIETSRSAEKVYLHDEKLIQEWHYRLEQSHSEINILREKLQWFENERHTYETRIQTITT